MIRHVVEQSIVSATLFSRFAAGRIRGSRAVGRAAVMGDAIHAMPPLGAHGGNTALRDAAALAECLLTGTDGPQAASDVFVQQMVAYASSAVADAEKQTQRLIRGGVGTWMLRRALPLLHRRVVSA